MPDAAKAAPTGAHAARETVKETLISVIIAFVLAFVFRGFVVEAFVIPTGSMAPTLLGQHMRFQSEGSGQSWAVGPRDEGRAREPLALQGAPNRPPIAVRDPSSAEPLEERSVPIRAGDRILVLKYLYLLREPKRYDVVVFKYPGNPATNYIKRLIGLPGEQLALVDGDVFTRPLTPGEPEPIKDINLWERSDWRIARKPHDAARAVWQTVYDSSAAPSPKRSRSAAAPFTSPWSGANWSGLNGRTLTSPAGPSVLTWNNAAPFDPRAPQPLARTWTVSDRYPYNEANRVTLPIFPVSDVRLRAGIALADTATTIEALVEARAHQFRALLEPAAGKALLQMRADAPADAPWQTLAQGAFAPFAAGRSVNVEFWHLDQSLCLFVGGRAVATGTYDWSPAQRIKFATGRTLADVFGGSDSTARSGTELADPGLYTPARLSWRFSGGPVTLHRVAVDRDLHYQPNARPGGAGYATAPIETKTLGPDQFFVCGDNSPNSADARAWDATPNENNPRGFPDPWVSATIDPTPGIVPRELMLGKAFFVYFPALAGSSPIPVPDFGRLRFIR
jgi:signal peptidase I